MINDHVHYDVLGVEFHSMYVASNRGGISISRGAEVRNTDIMAGVARRDLCFGHRDKKLGVGMMVMKA